MGLFEDTNTLRISGGLRAREAFPTKVAPTGGRMRQRLPDKRRCETFTVQVNQKSWHITVGFYQDGSVGEVFFVASKVGSDMRETLDLLGMSMSLALQHGTDISEFIALMSGTSDSHVMQSVAKGLEETVKA